MARQLERGSTVHSSSPRGVRGPSWWCAVPFVDSLSPSREIYPSIVRLTDFFQWFLLNLFCSLIFQAPFDPDLFRFLFDRIRTNGIACRAPHRDRSNTSIIKSNVENHTSEIQYLLIYSTSL